MYTRQKLQSEGNVSPVRAPTTAKNAHHLSHGALSYLASLQQTSKALRDGHIEDVLDRKAGESESKQRDSERRANSVLFSHENATVTDSTRARAVDHHRDSLASISSVISELWQQRDTPLKEIQIRDPDELSQISSLSETPLSHTSRKKHKYGNTDELQITTSDNESYEPGSAPPVPQKDHRESVNADPVRRRLATMDTSSFGSSERNTSIASLSHADNIIHQNSIHNPIFGTSKSASVSTGNVYGNVSDSRLRDIRKSIDLSLNSPPYAYDFDSDTSLDTLLTINSKAASKTRRTSVSIKEATTTRPRLATKQSPFKTMKTVRSGSSTDADSILDEMESIPEEVGSVSNVDSYHSNSPNSTESETIATCRELDKPANKRNDSDCRSLKVTRRQQNAGKKPRISEEEAEKGASSRTESTSSAYRKQLPRKSSKITTSTSKNSGSASGSTSSSSSASAAEILTHMHSDSDSEESDLQSSVTRSRSGSAQSERVSNTLLETANNESEARKEKKKVKVGKKSQRSPPANPPEDIVSQRSLYRSDTSDSAGDRRNDTSKRKQEEFESKRCVDDDRTGKHRLTECGRHNRTPALQRNYSMGGSEHIMQNLGVSKEPAERERTKNIRKSGQINSHGNSEHITSHGTATKKIARTRESSMRSTSHEDRLIDGDSAGGLKTDSKAYWKNGRQLAISAEELRQLVRVVVDEVIDGQLNPELAGKRSCSVQTDFYEEPTHTTFLDALPVQYFQGDLNATTDNKHVSSSILRLHIELLKREADRERRALREWDCIMHDFEQRCHVLGLDRLRKILNSRQLHNYI